MRAAITWLAEAEVQIARQKAFAARFLNEDKYIALQARLVLSQSLCCITEEIIRRSCDRIARISDNTMQLRGARGDKS